MNLIMELSRVLNSVWSLLNYDMVICGYNLKLWSFVALDVVLGGMCYVIGKGILTNE